MSVLQHAARRDLRAQRWSWLGIALTVLLGTGLFAASYDAFLNLESSYRRTYERLVFPDATVSGGNTQVIADRAGTIDGVSAVTVRRVADVPIRLGDHVLLGRVVELPARPAVGRLHVLTGDLQASTAGAGYAERHLAEHFGLDTGAEIEVYGADGWQDVEVVATVASAEYLWPARSRQDVLTTADDFGVVFLPTETFDSVEPDGAISEVLVRYASDVDRGRLDRELSATAGELGGTSTVRADQPSNAALQEDVAGFGELSFMFPALFLGASTMAAYILLSRLVRSRRGEIAVLRANGMSTRRLAAHFVGQGVAVTAASGGIGLILGVLAGRLVTGSYTAAIDVPDTVIGFHPSTVIAGLVLSALAGAVAAAAPAMAAAHTEPAAALRGIAPTGRGGRSVVERLVPPLRRLPARWRMVIRGLGRERRRSLSTIVGVVLAFVLVLASWGMVDTVEILLDRQFGDVQRQDAQVFVSDDAAADAIARAPGVDRVERVEQLHVVAVGTSERYATELLAFERSTRMHGFGATGPPTTGLVAGRSLADVLDVDVGDQVTLIDDVGSSVVLRVEGFVDEPLGTFVYADPSQISPLIADATPSVMVRFADGVDREAMRNSLTEIAGVVAYRDARSLYETAQGLLSLFYVFVGVMLAFGAVMSFALIVATTNANVSERSAELAALRVNGTPPAQLGRMVGAENLLLTAVASVPGLVLGWAISAWFMSSFTSDLFDFGLEIRARTLIVTTLAILAVSAAVQWPAGRLIARADVARIVRERSF